MLDELETEEKNEKYKKYFAELFNMATLPFYWDTLEPEKGKPRYARTVRRFIAAHLPIFVSNFARSTESSLASMRWLTTLSFLNGFTEQALTR
jgi:hypothetical protein